MGYLADIYVIKKSRSKTLGEDFLNHFLPKRKESADAYEFPQYAKNPSREFEQADELMTYLEENLTHAYTIYWSSADGENPNRQGMISYTRDGHMIFGISRNADMSGKLNTENEDAGLKEMKAFFETEMGYIHYESPPADTYDAFIQIVNDLNT